MASTVPDLATSTVPDLATAKKPKLPNGRPQQVLEAAGVGEISWLKNLAEQHHEAFTKELTNERVMAPDGVVRIATSCTGTGQEVFSLLAVIDVYRKLYPRFRVEYQFHCEKEPKKRAFVNTMHEVLKDKLGAECEPCCFDDITKLLKGTAKCSLHKNCECPCAPKDFDWYFCSSSCKDLSKEQGKHRFKGNCFADKNIKTTGGSSETYFAMTDVMCHFRPDLDFFLKMSQTLTTRVPIA